MKTKTAPNSDTLSVMEPQEEFITTEEVEQEIVPTVEVEQDVPVDIEGENDDDDEMMNDDEEALEVDMSNNSLTYFDKHTDSVFAIGHHPNLPLVCTGGGDNLAHLWTSHSQPPKFAGTLTGYGESVISCSFTSEGASWSLPICRGRFLYTWVKKVALSGSWHRKCKKSKRLFG